MLKVFDTRYYCLTTSWEWRAQRNHKICVHLVSTSRLYIDKASIDGAELFGMKDLRKVHAQ